MSSTRLLVLGAVKILQPATGYDLRRELLSWHLSDWMNIRTGSIYSALKTLEKDGFIAGEAGRETRQGTALTEYRMTPEGEKEFITLLRASWWRIENPTEPLVPALCLVPFMDRRELVGALRSRVNQLEGQLDELGFQRSTIADGAIGMDGETPEHVREVIDFVRARVRGEIDWARGFLKRLQDGAYVFADERTVPAPITSPSPRRQKGKRANRPLET